MYTSNPSARRTDLPTELKRRAIFACAIAVVMAGCVYINAVHNPFLYDDYRLIVENRSLADLSNFRAVIWHEVTRPLVNISYAVDYAIWGPSPFGFHLTNVLLHMVNVGLLAWIAWRSSGRPHVVAPIASLLFAVHPMLTDAVGYISGRSELLCGVFFLLAFICARQWLISRRIWWLVPVVFFWGLSLISKEIAAMFPFVVMAYDYWVLPSDAGDRKHRLLTAYGPLLAIAVLLALVRLAVFSSVEHGGGITPQWNFAWVELDVIRRYLMMLLLPTGQAIFHAIEPIGVAHPRAWLGLLFLALSGAVIWKRRRASPLQSFGLLWFFLLLLPSSALVVLDRGEPMVEHRVYLASWGFFLAVGVATADLISWVGPARGVRRIIIPAAVGVAVIALGGRTLVRNALWANPTLVWLEAAERAPNHWLPQLLLGEELHRSGQHREAATLFGRVVALRPQEVGAYAKLGVCLSEQNDLNGAAAAFAKMKSLDPMSSEASNGLAVVALLRGQVDDARNGYLETLKLDQANIAARRGLAVLEETAANNPAAALKWCEEIKRLAADTPGNDECIRRNQARIAGGAHGSH